MVTGGRGRETKSQLQQGLHLHNIYVRSHYRIRSRTSNITTKDMGLATLISINGVAWSAARDCFASVLGWPSTSMPTTGSTVSAGHWSIGRDIISHLQQEKHLPSGNINVRIHCREREVGRYIYSR